MEEEKRPLGGMKKTSEEKRRSEGEREKKPTG
jgi:hypothetical protein